MHLHLQEYALCICIMSVLYAFAISDAVPLGTVYQHRDSTLLDVSRYCH